MFIALHAIVGPRREGLSESLMRLQLNFQSLEVVSRYRDPQLQETENLRYLFSVLNPYITTQASPPLTRMISLTATGVVEVRFSNISSPRS